MSDKSLSTGAAPTYPLWAALACAPLATQASINHAFAGTAGGAWATYMFVGLLLWVPINPVGMGAVISSLLTDEDTRGRLARLGFAWLGIALALAFNHSYLAAGFANISSLF